VRLDFVLRHIVGFAAENQARSATRRLQYLAGNTRIVSEADSEVDRHFVFRFGSLNPSVDEADGRPMAGLQSNSDSEQQVVRRPTVRGNN